MSINFSKCPACGGKIELVTKEGFMYFHCKDNDCIRGSEFCTSRKEAFGSWCKEVNHYCKIVVPYSK